MNLRGAGGVAEGAGAAIGERDAQADGTALDRGGIRDTIVDAQHHARSSGRAVPFDHQRRGGVADHRQSGRHWSIARTDVDQGLSGERRRRHLL